MQTGRRLSAELAASDDVVSIEGVSKAFNTGNRKLIIVEDVNLQIRRCRFVTLIGPSGCGTSTPLRIVAGLLTVDRGTVSIFGETVSLAGNPSASATFRRRRPCYLGGR